MTSIEAGDATVRRRPVRGRSQITAQNVADVAEVDDPQCADQLRALWQAGRAESTEYARRLRLASAFHAGRLDDTIAEDTMDDADAADMAVATALRITTGQAHTLIRNGRIAVTRLPRMLDRLADAHLPVSWFQHLLRSTRELSAEGCRLVDDHVAEWELENIAVARFRREVRLLVSWAAAHDADQTPETPEQARDVQITDACPRTGIARLEISGPTPEIVSLCRRLDTGARALQRAQRAALENDEPVPFDSDGAVSAQGRALSLRALRYAILTRSITDTGGIEVPAERFRLSVTVPMLTLLGASDAPAVLDGEHPVPAQMARELAAGEDLWHRILTDPATGIFLPTTADPYCPTAAMREHLRLRHPVCAAPGCTRTTGRAAEIDHIEEFDHHRPRAGGLTELENLHLLCWRHHQLKTARRIDPERRRRPTPERIIRTQSARPQASQSPLSPSTGPSSTGAPPPVPDVQHPRHRSGDRAGGSEAAGDPPSSTPPGSTRWLIEGVTATEIETEIEDNRDLVTPLHAQAMMTCWRSHRARRRAQEQRQGAGPRPSARELGRPDGHHREYRARHTAGRSASDRTSSTVWTGWDEGWKDDRPPPF